MVSLFYLSFPQQEWAGRTSPPSSPHLGLSSSSHSCPHLPPPHTQFNKLKKKQQTQRIFLLKSTQPHCSKIIKFEFNRRVKMQENNHENFEPNTLCMQHACTCACPPFSPSLVTTTLKSLRGRNLFPGMFQTHSSVALR